MIRPGGAGGAAGDLLLGVDGAGQTTQAVIATGGGEILGRGLGPPSNYHRVGIDNARRALSTAIEGALAAAHRSSDDRNRSWAQAGIAAACFGLAGVNGPADEAVFASWLRELGGTFKFKFINDSEMILGGGTPDGWGVALISGTGSVCLGRTAEGRVARVGGWGHLLGDEGSGYQMALEALKLATQAADGRGGSQSILRAALNHWRVNEAKDLIPVIYESTTVSEDILAFGIRVLDLAARNDQHAREIMDRASKALAVQIDTVIAKLNLTAPPIALSGATMRVTLRKALLEKIASPIGPVVVVADPVRGAVAVARRLVHAAPTHAA
jgi:N-acetylglucosamine kinase-like BadF-type ATPase